MMITFFVILLFALVVSASARGFKRSLADIPNPMTDPLACGRKNVAHSAICDPDNFVKKNYQDEVEGYINALTSAEIAVVVIKQMSLQSVHTLDVDLAAERFATGLHDRFGLGDKALNNGILVFLSIDDRSVYISRGHGFEEKLNHETIQLIITNMKPFLKRGDYGRALAMCMTSIDVILSDKDRSMIETAFRRMPKTYGKAVDNSEEGSDIVVWILVAAFFGFLGFSLWSSSQSRSELSNYDAGKTKLETLLRDMELSQEAKNKFEAKSCPICLEDFDSMNADSQQANSLRCSLAADLGNNSVTTESPVPSAEGATEDDVPPPPGTNIVHSKTVTLRCGHVFCIPCMETYLSSERSNRCPICRKPLSGPLSDFAEVDSANQRPNGGEARLRRNTGSSPTLGSDRLPTQPPLGSQESTSSSSSRTRGWFSGFGRRTAVHPYNYEETSYHSVSSSNNGGTQTQTFTTTTTTTDTSGNSPHYDSSYSSSYDPHYHRRFGYYSPEWRFRLHRMHYLYPSVVDYEFLRIANSAINRGSQADLRHIITQRGAEVQRLATDLRQRMEKAARSSGSRGSSRSSFGGGRSSGGGGGRW